MDWDEGFLLCFANYLGLDVEFLMMDRGPLFLTFLALVSISYVASSLSRVASSCMVSPSCVTSYGLIFHS